MSNDRTLYPSEGRHAAVCRFVQITDNGKNQAVVMTFELIDPSPQPGTMISYFGYLGDNSIGHTVRALQNCGWTGDNLAELPQLAEADMLAQVVELVISHETFEGKRRAKVNWVNRPGGAGKIQLEHVVDGPALSDFGQRMRSKITAARGGAGRSRAISTGRPPGDDVPPPSDRDLPF